jgi:hypothetical protein
VSWIPMLRQPAVRKRTSVAGLLLTLMCALAASGCGSGSGSDAVETSGPTVSLSVTSEMGGNHLSGENHAPLTGHGTVLRLLREYNDVTAIFDDEVIESIDERYTQELPFPTVWALNVNGVEADVDPIDYKLFAGDVVQLDLRYWHATLDVRATVGAFPETFRRGVFGKRFPVTVVCESQGSRACRHVKDLLAEAGVATDGSAPTGELPPRGQPRRARIFVGTWQHWRDRPWAARIDRGPRYSGVFGRFTSAGDGLRLLDWESRPIRTERSGTGLVAAMRPTEEDLTWFVTGVDEQGVERAAQALDDESLRDAFSVAVTEDGVVRLPLKPIEPVTGEPRS